MIIRARPKYLDNINILQTNLKVDIKENEFYFNSGRAALKFYLQYLSNKFDKQLTIGLQAFNCKVVLDAILESNCKAYLFDIKLEDFSIAFDSIKKVYKELDILLLTHYQGIPNSEYIDIINFCNFNNIIVIEDMAQTYGSTINNVKVGTLGDISIYSYAFDKPFSVFYGGKIEFNKSTTEEFKKLFLNLPYESNQETLIHLQLLSFFYKYSDKKYYRTYIDNYKIVELFLRLNISFKLLYKIMFIFKSNLLSKVANKLINRFLPLSSLIEMKKMKLEKIIIIKKQEKQYDYKDSNIDYIKELCIKYGIKDYTNNKSQIHWNRYSVLDENSILKNKLLSMNIQVGNYNWSTTLDKLYSHCNIIKVEDLKNSYFVSQNILNIPIWSMPNDK